MRKIKQNELLESITNEVKKTVNNYKKTVMYEALKHSINEVKYNRLKNIIKECTNQVLNEGVNNQNYTHFAVLKPINKIVNGWDYADVEPVELRNFRKYYFFDDMIDYGFDPKDIKILTKAACLRQGLNPEDESCWDNAYEYKVESVNRKNSLKEEYGEPVQSDDQDPEDYQPMEAIDFYDFENICHSNGWDWHSSFDVNNGEQTGVRYVFAQGKGCTFEELVNQIKQKADDPNGIIAGTATNRNAPEISYYSIIVLYV